MPTDDVDVEAGVDISVRNEEKLLMFSPQIYWAVPDTLANAPNHLIYANIVEVIRRDDLEADNFVVYGHIVLALFMIGLCVGPPAMRYGRTLILHRIPACTLVFDKSPSSCAM